MRRRILAITAGLVLAGSLAPAANAYYYAPREQPPHCETAASNVILDDPFCEETEFDNGDRP